MAHSVINNQTERKRAKQRNLVSMIHHKKMKQQNQKRKNKFNQRHTPFLQVICLWLIRLKGPTNFLLLPMLMIGCINSTDVE